MLKLFHRRKTKAYTPGTFDHIYTSIYEKLQGPEMVEWFPSYVCNSHCVYCGGYDRQAQAAFQEPVAYRQIIDFVKTTAQAGVTVWNVGGRGGEPFLYPDLIGVLRQIKRYRMQGILITNGLVVDKDKVRHLAKMRWDVLRISLDSSRASVHDQIRGVPGNFVHLHEMICYFQQVKMNRKEPLPSLTCCTVVSNRNYALVSELIDYCIVQGIEEIEFMPLMEVHERARELSLDARQKEELIALLRPRREEKRIRHNIDFFLSLYGEKFPPVTKDVERDRLQGVYCIHLWKTLVISEDGYLSPCSLIKDKLLKIEKSYASVWESSQMNELRKKVLSRELIAAECRQCCGPLRKETQDFNEYLRHRSLRL